MNEGKAQSAIVEVSEKTFEAEVLNSKQMILVEFTAGWSHPCQVLDAVLGDLMTSGPGGFKVVRVNADNHPDLSLWFGIQSIPTLLFFSGGKVRTRIVGTASREAILAKLQSLFPSGNDAPLSSAREQLPQT